MAPETRETPVADRVGEVATELGVLARLRLDLLREDLRGAGWRGLEWLGLQLVLAAAAVTAVVLLLQGAAQWIASAWPAGPGAARVVVGGGALVLIAAVARGLRFLADRRHLNALRRRYDDDSDRNGNHEANGRETR